MFNDASKKIFFLTIISLHAFVSAKQLSTMDVLKAFPILENLVHTNKAGLADVLAKLGMISTTVLGHEKFLTGLSKDFGQMAGILDTTEKKIVEFGKQLTTVQSNNQALAIKLARYENIENIIEKSLYAAIIIASAYGAWKLGWWIKAKLDAKKQQVSVKQGKIA